LSPGGGDLEENPFEAEFQGPDEDDYDDSAGLDFGSPGMSAENSEIHNFAVLNSSLPGEQQHHLSTYASAKRSGATRDKRHRTKWHFGIRSRSPPMEIMLEIYKTLKVLGMEWKEKGYLGGLGGVHLQATSDGRIERIKTMDGGHDVDMRPASKVYFVETRGRVGNVVVGSHLFESKFLHTDSGF